MLNPEQSTTLERKIERFAHILAQKPGDGLTVLALAEASFRRGLKLEALTNYQVVTSEQAVPEAHLAVAEIYSQQSMATEAYGELRQLFRIDPENVEARLLAQTLRERSAAPEDIMKILNEPTSDEAFAEAKLRLQIQRAIHNRELQERTRNGTLEPGVVIHEYYIEEAKKKLIEVQDCLRKLEELKEHNTHLREMPRPEPVSAQPDLASETADLEEEQSQPSVETFTPAEDMGEPDLISPEDLSVPAEEDLVATHEVEEPEPSQDHALVQEELPPSEEFQAPAPPEEFSSHGVVEVPSPIEFSNEPEPIAILEEDLQRPSFLEESEEQVDPADPADPAGNTLSFQPTEESSVLAPTEDHPSVSYEPVAEAVADTPFDQGPEPIAVDAYPTESLESDEARELPNLEAPPEEHSSEPPVPEPPTPELLEDGPVEQEEELSFTPEAVSPASLEETQAHHFDPPSLEDIPNQLLQSGEALEPELPAPSEETQAIEMEDFEDIPQPTPVIQEEVDFAAAPAPEPVPVSTSDSFDLNFEIGVDNLVSPDLPEESYTPPPSIEMSTIEIDSLEMSPTPIPPAIDFVEEQGDELSLSPSAETEPVELPSQRDVSPQGRAAERQAFYESKAEELGKLTGTLARTRGVTSIFLVARDGSTIDSVVKDDITEERVGELVRESFDFLLAYATSPAYWVLECSGGIFVMQTLDDFHVLIAIGQAGANFGALRYTMDKTKTKFGEILNDAPR